MAGGVKKDSVFRRAVRALILFIALIVFVGWYDVVELPHPFPTVFYILRSAKSLHVEPIVNYDNEVERIGGVEFTHHFVHIDKTIRSNYYSNITFHYVEAGPATGEPIVFLHGIPDTWYLWHKQMIDLSKDGYRCLSFDVKGYGQSSKPLSQLIWPAAREVGGTYDRSIVGDELITALEKIGVAKFNLVSLDLSSWQAPIMAGEWNDRILRYCKAQSTVGIHDKKHVPQIYLFRGIPRVFTYLMESNPPAMVKILHGKTGLPALERHRRCKQDIPDDIHERAVREFAHHNNYRSWAGFYNALPVAAEVTPSQTVAFRNYTFPTLLLQGKWDPAQPYPEYYDGSKVLDCYRNAANESLCDIVDVPEGRGRVKATDWFPNAPWVELVVVEDAGHYIPHERPEAVTAALRKWLAVDATKRNKTPPSLLRKGKERLDWEEWFAWYDSIAFKNFEKRHRVFTL